MSITDRIRPATGRGPTHKVGPAVLPRSAATASIAGLGTLTLAAIVGFDLGPPVALNDDYAYAWSARHFLTGPIYPAQTALALPQVAVGWLLSLPFAHDQRVLRISILALLLPGCWAAYRLSRRLGAGEGWSLLSPVAMISSPIFFNLSVTFMSDIAYVALLLLACKSGIDWLEDGRPRATFALWATLATLQRLFGVGLVLALAVVLVVRFRRERRSLRGATLTWLAIAASSSALAAVMPGLLGVSAGLNVADRLAHLQVDALLNPLVHLPLMAGYLTLPFVWAIAIAWNRWSIAIALLSVAVVIVVLWRSVWLPGNIWTYVGPAPTLSGYKPMPVPFGVSLLLVAASAMTFLLIGPSATQRWVDGVKKDERVGFLILVSALQLLFLIPNTLTLFDRYYLPVIAPLLPVLAALGQRHSRPGGLWVGAVASFCLLVLACVFEVDYQSWQTARDTAARAAYLCAPPDRVNAGYEANAVYIEIPAFEASGKAALGRLSRRLTLDGPPDPALWLTYAGPDDPRPGVAYGILTRGKVVINGAVCSAIHAR